MGVGQKTEAEKRNSAPNPVLISSPLKLEHGPEKFQRFLKSIILTIEESEFDQIILFPLRWKVKDNVYGKRLPLLTKVRSRAAHGIEGCSEDSEYYLMGRRHTSQLGALITKKFNILVLFLRTTLSPTSETWVEL